MFELILTQSGVAVSGLVLSAVGFSIGLLSGLLGVGGGWLITPALNILGLPMIFSVGTGLAQMTGTSFLAGIKHLKSGNLDIKVGTTIGLAMVIGVQIGKGFLDQLNSTGQADLVTRVLYMIMLIIIGGLMFKESFAAYRGVTPKEGKVSLSSKVDEAALGPRFYSKVSEKHIPWFLLIGFGLFGGVLSGLLGVGGGFFLMPAMVYVLGMPTVVAVATSLLCVLIASIYGTFLFTMGGQVEFLAVGALLSGALIGSFMGVQATQYVKGEGLRLLFSILVLLAALSIVFKQFGYDQVSSVVIFGAVSALVLWVVLLLGKNLIAAKSS